MNRSALFILYCSLFLPYLTYCAEIWGNTYKSNIQCIFLLQKKIVRIVYGANFKDQTDVIFQDLNFLKFYDLVKLKTCDVMYRAKIPSSEGIGRVPNVPCNVSMAMSTHTVPSP